MLRENSDRRLAIFDTAVRAIVEADKDGAIQSFNWVAETIFGYSAEEAVERNVRLLMSELDRSGHDDVLASNRQTEERKIIGIGCEVVGRHKDGSIVSSGPFNRGVARYWRPVLLHQNCARTLLLAIYMRASNNVGFLHRFYFTVPTYRFGLAGRS
jgi:PAS domain S-box-containing protein